MKNIKIFVSCCFILLAAACQQPQNNQEEKANSSEQEEAKKPNQVLAEKYGLESFSEVDTIEFTFNVRRDENADTSSRQWMWLPKENLVSLNIGGNMTQFKRDTVQSEKFKGMDAAFINDQYWLLYPFRTYWDTGTNIEMTKAALPFETDTVQAMTVSYIDSAGYTPNDTYKLFLDEEGMVTAWEYYHKSGEKPSLVTKWENLKSYNGIKIASHYPNPETGFLIYFDNIAVK